MKTVLLLLNNEWSVRNFVLTGVVSRLAEKVRLVALLPGRCVEGAAPHAGRAELRPLPPPSSGFIIDKLTGLKDELWFHGSPTETIRLKRDTRDEAYVNLGPLRTIAGAAAYGLGLRMKHVDHLQILAEKGGASFAGGTLRDVRPDLFVGTPLFRGADAAFVRLCRRRGIPSVSFIQSWDNVSAKSYIPTFPDRLLVWNDHVGRDLVRYHGVDPASLVVVGIPQFDLYREIKKEDEKGRRRFLESEGLDPSRRLVVYTTATPRWPLAEERTVRLLAEAIRRGDAPNAQLLVRPHPLEDPRRYEEAAADTGATIQRTLGGGAGGWSLEDIERLGRTMRHADAVVNFMSTVTIDASYFGAPVVNTMYAVGRVPRKEKLPRYYRSTHYLPILQSGGVRVASSPVETVRLVAEYLRDPSLDAEGRRRIVREQIVFEDGGSARRTAEAILEML